ncbi:MAG: hypothetical protein MPK75_12535, partial [Alphaproteobacteria bacterium]|nr:hypothetical protein [Alphaproteobacteria bacterium]
GRGESDQLCFEVFSGGSLNMKSAVIRTGIFLAAVFGPAAVAVADICQPYVGEVVEAVDFKKMEELLRKSPIEKGEFETTEEFEKRTAKFLSSLPEKFFIGYTMHTTPHYDADTQQMEFHEHALVGNEKYHTLYGYGSPSRENLALLNEHFEFKEKSFYSHNQREITPADIRSLKKEIFEAKDVLDILVSKERKHTGSYRASSALGASVSVEQYGVKTQIILDRDDHIDALVDYPEPIAMTVEKAKDFKRRPKAAVLATPKSPYFGKQLKKTEPTFSDPVEITEDISVIYADIQCVFVLDGKNKVFGSFATN